MNDFTLDLSKNFKFYRDYGAFRTHTANAQLTDNIIVNRDVVEVSSAKSLFKNANACDVTETRIHRLIILELAQQST